jgi:hypothetical protein
MIFVILFVLFLVVNKTISLYMTITMILMYVGLFCYCLYSFVYTSKTFNFLSFKGILGLIFFTTLTITCTLSTIFFFSINLMIANELGENLTLEEKMTVYMLPFLKEKTNSTDYLEIKAHKLSTTYHNVEIFYEPNEKDLLPIIKHTLNKTDNLTTNLFGKVDDNDIDLILHSSSEEIYEQTSLMKTMGYFDDPNDIIGIAISDLDEILSDQMPGIFYFQSTIMHEYTHYRLQTFMKEQGLYINRIPLWFHEGVAEYVGMHEVAHRYYPFKEAPFEKLISHKDWEKYRFDEYDVYIQSYYAIDYLVNNYGEEIIKVIIEETAEVNNFDKGFSRATGISIKELQKVYLKDFQLGMNQ